MAPLRKLWGKMRRKFQRKTGLGSFAPLEPWIATENAKATGEIKKATPIPVRRSISKKPAKARPVHHQDSSFEDTLQNRKPEVESMEDLKTQRENLERDVARLEKKLVEERDIRAVYQLAHDEDSMTAFRSHSFVSVPEKTKEFVLEMGLLEFHVSRLELEISAMEAELQRRRLNGKKDQEQVSERSSGVEKSEPPAQSRPSPGGSSQPDVCATSAADTGTGVSKDFDTDDDYVHEAVSEDLYGTTCDSNTSVREKPGASSVEPKLPPGTSKDFEQNLGERSSSDAFTEETFPSSSTSNDSLRLSSALDSVCGECGDKSPDNEQPSSLKEEEHVYSFPSRRYRLVDDPWHHPNSLSEQMVYRMMDIYQQLGLSEAVSYDPGPSGSPVTPFGYSAVSSSSKTSFSGETSGVSRGPLLDRRSKAGLVDSWTDPYRSDDRLTPPGLQAYRLAIHVSSLRVGETELEYAAEALSRFKVLVECLAKVDVSRMEHAEKLAFWINIYNALMMHAFLAYGTPDSDDKYFTLMRRACYVVGGYSFNASTIMHTMLMSQASTFRSYLEGDCSRTMTKEQLSFGITHPEPFTVFALSFGAWSCPAVRLYTQDGVHEQLQTALEEFAQASVGICWEKGQVIIPKLLYHYHRDVLGGENSDLFSWVSKHIPSVQLRGMMQQRNQYIRGDRNVTLVVPVDYRFRYLFIYDGFQAS